MHDERTLHALTVAFLCSLVGCGSAPPPVPPEVLAEEERRLLRPYQDKRVVVADAVELQMSANFLGSRMASATIDELIAAGEGMGSMAANRVALPVVDKNLHAKHEGRDGEDVVATYVNKLGGVERPLTLLVGQTQYRALQGLTVRVLGSGAPMTLDVAARGDVTVLAAGAQRLDVPEFVIKDGLHMGQ